MTVMPKVVPRTLIAAANKKIAKLDPNLRPDVLRDQTRAIREEALAQLGPTREVLARLRRLKIPWARLVAPRSLAE